MRQATLTVIQSTNGLPFAAVNAATSASEARRMVARLNKAAPQGVALFIQTDGDPAEIVKALATINARHCGAPVSLEALANTRRV